MTDQRLTIRSWDLARWAVVALLLLTGIGLFFVFGRRTEAVVHPSVQETR